MTSPYSTEASPLLLLTVPRGEADRILAGLEVDSMKAVAAAYQARSLQAFQDTLAAHRPQLVDDAFVNAHLTVRQRLARGHRRRALTEGL